MQIGGLSVLKGLILYGATLTFAGFYAYFMEQIVVATSKQPELNAPMVAAAAALAGILGSAFAVWVGVPTTATNDGLGRAMAAEKTRATGGKGTLKTRIRKLVSLEPAGH